ncbi:EF-hand domain-containing family member B-like [Uloborus diversus]|uniref:EF-hand domain-containing family member B-like n=1 Tax=Uloborus diversus TaxID=327109 RepID=UPI00240A4570|nr:EF-hand domain-containing family member B-like [Uloborus diversus]
MSGLAPALDLNGTNKITVLDLQKMCQKFGISVPQHMYEKLLEECDIIDKDGAISYDEFVHCLNWKDLLKENAKLKKSRYANDWRENCINCNSKNSLEDFRTTYSAIGDHSHKEFKKTAGLPNRRFECGDVKNGAEVIQPNVFAKYGVYDDDLNMPRMKQEVQILFYRSGINVDSEMFEMVWKGVNKNGKASILSVWNEMKKLCLI